MRLRNVLFWACALLPGAQAQASDQGPGYITTVQFTGSRILFLMSGTRTARPACDCCARWELDGSSTTGQSQVAIMLTAYSLHKAVTVYGAGSCVAGSNDTEAVSLFSGQ